jgi:hypothetical protein
MRAVFRRRLLTITTGSLACAVVAAVALTVPFPPPTRIICGCLLAGSTAAIGFWTLRLWTFPTASPVCQRWLLACYALGVSALVFGLAAGVWGVLTGVGEVAHGWFLLLLAIEVGEHFGVRWVDGQGRFLVRPWLGGAARTGLFRPARRIRPRCGSAP